MKKIKARLLPLGNKYYGTEIELTVDNQVRTFKVWLGWGKPSKRELELNGTTIDDDEAYDECHYESQLCFDICSKIVNALNK